MAVVNAGFVGPQGVQAALSICDRTSACTPDDYVETHALGDGGFGSVVMAHHRVTGETVVVKKFHSSAEQGGNSTKAVLREAWFLLECAGHRSIVQLRAISFNPFRAGNLSLVMECVGPSLHDVLYKLRRGRPFPENMVRVVMWQLLGAAKHMHERLIVHRDIKPQNVLVGVNGVKVCDLGLAISMYGAPPYSKAGTRRYMAPEMLLGKKDYDSRVDMWSLGCVMAELLLGKPLFDGEDDKKQIVSIFRVLRPIAEDPPSIWHRSLLDEIFPEERLSREGLDALKGLLSCKFSQRMSAAATLAIHGSRGDEDSMQKMSR